MVDDVREAAVQALVNAPAVFEDEVHLEAISALLEHDSWSIHASALKVLASS